MKKCIWIFIILILSISIFLPANYSIEEISAESTAIEFTDKYLENRLKTLLNKDKLYPDSIINDGNYKATYDAVKDSYSAKRTCLDLSGANISDIRELAQFKWPQSLTSINLSYNNITYENFKNIYSFYSIKEDDEIAITPIKSIKSKCDFSLLKCINVSNNNIDLQSVKENNDIDMNNEVFIYGLQNYNNALNNALITKEDIENTSYYIRHNDYNTLSITMYYYSDAGESVRPDEPMVLTYDNVTKLSSIPTGKYEILISALDNGYLSGTHFDNIKFALFEGKILPNSESKSEYFEVERLGNFTLPLSQIDITGLGSLEYTAINKDGGTTTELDINECQIIVESEGYTSKTLLLPYKVVDTTPPVITLIGGANLPWNLNEPWNDPGCIVYDNGAKVKDIITPIESVKYTLIGEYNLTYTYTDIAGNTTSVIRTVYVQEGVLSSITLYTTNEKIEVGKDIVFIAQPYNIDNSKYSDFEYTWIINDEIYDVLSGDKTHKCSLTYTPKDKTPLNIKVKVTAKQTIDGKSIPMPVYSNQLTLEPTSGLSTTTLTIIIFSGAVAILIIVIATITIYKAKHSKIASKSRPAKVSRKKSNKSKNDEDDNNTKNITIIKDYRGK